MNYHKELLSKNGATIMALAKEFLSCRTGDKIPTVSEFCEKVGLARGTIQNSIKFLQKNNAIELEARGHLGTFLKSKNIPVLLEYSGITSIVGVMPLPYSKRYEGLASGLIVAMQNNYNIPCSMAYMRGAYSRVNMLLVNRYDFAVVSHYAAQEMIESGEPIRIVKAFGPHSFLSHHIVVFHNKNKKAIEDGMKVGIDSDSLDQMQLTKKACEGKKVEFVEVGYNQIVNRIVAGEIDAAVWNEDEILDKVIDINYAPLPFGNTLDTEAVIVVNKQRTELVDLLSNIIDVETVLRIQKDVVEKKMTPSY